MFYQEYAEIGQEINNSLFYCYSILALFQSSILVNKEQMSLSGGHKGHIRNYCAGGGGKRLVYVSVFFHVTNRKCSVLSSQSQIRDAIKGNTFVTRNMKLRTTYFFHSKINHCVAKWPACEGGALVASVILQFIDHARFYLLSL